MSSETVLKNNTFLNKNVLITGATAGLGKQLALKYAQYGATIIGIGRDESKIKSLKTELSKINNNDHLIKSIDVSDNLLMSQLAFQLSQSNILPDVIISNAAGNFVCPFEKLSYNGWNRINDIVLNGMFNTYHCFGKELILKKKPAVFLNISTTYAETGSAGVVPSAVAKAGCDALMKSLTSEWAKYGHRFVAVAPGPIANSGGADKLDPLGIFKKFVKYHNPRNRMCEPEEIAEFVCFLTSNYGDYVNGTVIRMDGGELNVNSGEFNLFFKIKSML